MSNSIPSTPPGVTAGPVPPYGSTRRVVFWLVVAAAVAALVLSAIDTFKADPRQGEGWIGGVIEAVFMAGPLAFIAVGLRSQSRITARRTAVASLLLALAVTFVLVMQVLDPNENNQDRLIQVLGVLVYLAAFAVEVPALRGRWPS